MVTERFGSTNLSHQGWNAQKLAASWGQPWGLCPDPVLWPSPCETAAWCPLRSRRSSAWSTSTYQSARYSCESIIRQPFTKTPVFLSENIIKWVITKNIVLIQPITFLRSSHMILYLFVVLKYSCQGLSLDSHLMFRPEWKIHPSKHSWTISQGKT